MSPNPRRRWLRTNQRLETLEKRMVLTSYLVDFDLLEPTDYTHSEVLVRFHDHVQVDSLQSAVSTGPRREALLTAPLGDGFFSDSQLHEIPVMPGQSVQQLIEYYSGLDIVEYAEPNYRMEAAAAPNDQFYGILWGMQDIGAESAWDTRTSSDSVIVGVIDSGVQYDHPDLVGNIWTNDGEIPNNNIDDDGNGYVDDYYGYDFDNDDSDPMDDNGHGTHVAGTIGAQGNNGIGVAGVGWDASLMSLKVIGTGSNADVARAIDYATANGAKITNNSYGYAGTNVGGSRVMSDAIDRAKDSGVLYIVAAGNSRSGTPASDMDGNFNSWPAEYSKVHDNVITVAALDQDGSFAGYSHWGDESVQIAAPGSSIGSTYVNDGYVYLSGTSMAAPHVAGAAALLWAERPELSYLEIKDAILSTADPVHTDRVGEGKLDLAAAMNLVSSTTTTNDPPVAADDSANVNEDSSIAISVLNNDSDPDSDPLTVQSFSQPSNGSVTISNNVLTYAPDVDFNGSDTFTYTINDGNGNTASAAVSVTVASVNDAPLADNDSATTNQETPVSIDVLANDSDIDSSNLSISGISDPSNGSVSDNGNGTVTYTPDAGFFGNDSFTYTITDGSLSDSATVSVVVEEVVTNAEIGVSGTATNVTHNWTTVSLPVSFNNPVVVAGGSTRRGGHQGVVRVRNVTSDSFQIRFQEWDYRDGWHTTENIGYLVVEAGTHFLPDGTQLVAGTTTLTNESFKTVSFGDSFAAAPLVLGQVMTNNDAAAVVERIRRINSNNFQIQFNEEEVADGIHATETVGFIAIDKGAASSGEVSLNAVATGNSVTHGNTTVNFGSIGGSSSPVILSDMQTRDGGDAATLRHRSQTSTSVTVFVEEEASRDSELNHTTEVAGVLALEPGILVAGNPLLASEVANGRGGDFVTSDDIELLTDGAINYWREQGLDTSSLDNVNFQVTDLRNNAIGMQIGNTILIDADAAGHGWYIDADVSTTERFAGMDLYTTMVHELGHVLGHSDVYDASRSDDIMYGFLNQGQRRGNAHLVSVDRVFSDINDLRF